MAARAKKARRRYALYERMPNGKWRRISSYSYFKASAVQIFQGSLLSGYFEGKEMGLRPVPTCSICEVEITDKPPRKLCRSCEDRALRATSEAHKQ